MAQKTAQEDEEGSSFEANSKERAASGKAAGTSGRSDERPADGEDWDQEEFGKGDRKSNCVMVEHPPGSNIWYNGTPTKWTDTDVLFSLGVDNVKTPPTVWVRLTSSRIWRGSLDAKNWRYSKNGAWKPRAPAGGARRAAASKGKGGQGRKRKAAGEPQDSDYVNGEATGTTKAQQDSDEEMVDTGHCTSPRQAVDRGAGGSDGTAHPAKPSPSSKQEDKGSAKPIKVPPVEVKEEGKASAERPPAPRPSQANQVFQAWLSRHFRLLETQGQLNIAPEGCNAEAGRLPGSACADSTRTAEGSLQGRETSSSSGSAGLKQQGSHTGRKLQPVAKTGSKSAAVLEPPRSPSPSTPSKPVDGSRRERSSSADMDLRLQPAQAGGAQRGSGGVPDVGSHGSKTARRATPPGADAGQEKQAGRGHGGKKSEGGAQGPRVSGATEGRAAKQSGKDHLSVKQGVTKQQTAAKAQKKVKPGWGKPGSGGHHPPGLKRPEPPVATLVETDPFTVTDHKKLRAC